MIGSVLRLALPHPGEMPDTLTILNIETHVLLVPDVNPEAMSSSQDEFRPSPAPRSLPTPAPTPTR